MFATYIISTIKKERKKEKKKKRKKKRKKKNKLKIRRRGKLNPEGEGKDTDYRREGKEINFSGVGKGKDVVLGRKGEKLRPLEGREKI